MASRRTLGVALAVPIVAAAGVAVVALADGDEPAPVALTSDAPRFDSLDELVAASDLVVVGTVADGLRGPRRHRARSPRRRVPHQARRGVRRAHARPASRPRRW